MNDQTIRTGVLIVGGGPTGLTLANILGCAGVPFMLVDRKPSTIDEPRAVSIDDESLRAMQAIGVADEVTRNVVSGYGVHYFTRHGGRCFGRVVPTASEYGFPRRNAFRQPLFEATLRGALERFNHGQTRFGHTLESFEQDEEGVNAVVSDAAGQRFTVRASWLIGCDGGRSPVREMLGIQMVGSTFKSRWLVIDTRDDDDPFTQMRVYCDPRRAIVDVPGPHRTRRFEILVHPGEVAEAMLEPARIRQLLLPLRGDRDTHIVRKTVYTFHARVAERWQAGRVFLAGDAAHLTPPYAGQGMNSGVRDAFNLGWKLAAIFKGQLPQSIMDSYEMERRDHAWALIKLALNLGVVMAPSSRFSAWAFQSFFTFAGYIRPLRNFFLEMKFKPKPRFSEGLLGPRDEMGKASLRGRMLPQPTVTLADGANCMLDELLGQRFALIQYGSSHPDEMGLLEHELWRTLNAVRIRILPAGSASATERDGVRTVVDTHDRLAVPLARYAGRMLVVRPDRYVAGSFASGAERQFADAYAERLGLGRHAAVRRAMHDAESGSTTAITT